MESDEWPMVTCQVALRAFDSALEKWCFVATVQPMAMRERGFPGLCKPICVFICVCLFSVITSALEKTSLCVGIKEKRDKEKIDEGGGNERNKSRDPT